MRTKRSFLERIKKISYATFAASFGLTPFISSMLLVFFLVSNFFILIIEPIQKSGIKRTIPFVLPFIIYIICLPYTYDFKSALSFILKSLPILILPLLFGLNITIVKKYKDDIIKYYLNGLLISCIISILIGCILFANNFNMNKLMYYELAEYLSLHPTYYSLYLLLGVILLMFSYEGKQWYKVMVLTIFVVTIILLQSRIAYVCLILLSVLKIKSSLKKGSFISISALLVFILLMIFAVPNSLKRLEQTFYYSENLTDLIGNENENGVTQRLWLWENAMNHIKERIVLGHGLKSQKKIFKWKIHKHNLSNKTSYDYKEAALEVGKLNLHNQYLQILYESGLVGFLFFLVSIFYIIKEAFRGKNYLFIYCYGLFLIFLLTENLLDRQMGIYFYSFMYPFLYLLKSEDLTLSHQSFQK